MDIAKAFPIASGQQLLTASHLLASKHTTDPVYVSLLVGIPLSRVDGDYQGNLCVWPGSHFLLHKYCPPQFEHSERVSDC